MFKLLLVAALAGLVNVPAATASTVTYTFNNQFASFSNNLNAAPDNGPGGILTGSLTLDPALVGDAIVVSYALNSYLPNGSGGATRTASYDSSLANQEFRLNTVGGTVLQLLVRGGVEWQRLVLDFGASLLGDNPIAVTASENYYKCKTVFLGGYPKNSCQLSNYGVGLGTGVLGANGVTQMLASAEGAVTAAVPLPAGAPLLAGALGLLALFRRQGRKAAAA